MITLTSGAFGVSFRNPDLGNKYSIDGKFISRLTRGGNAIFYRNQNWQVVTTEIWAFKHIRSTVRDNIETFLYNTLGQVVIVQTQRATQCGLEPRIFRGFIVSDVVDYTVIGKDGCAEIYEFGLVIAYNGAPVTLEYLTDEHVDAAILTTEDGKRLTNEAGS